MERRTKELVEQRKQERQDMEMENAKLERQKKYLMEILKWDSLEQKWMVKT